MEFQYFSDVHCEMYTSNPEKITKFDIKPCAPYLILAGDIGHPFSQIYDDFLTLLSPQYKHIFITSGNHEYYKTNYFETLKIPEIQWMQSVDQKIYDICRSKSNITYLQDDIYEFSDNNLAIYGATFWTNIKPEERSNVRQYLIDYREIPGFSMEVGIKKHEYSCNTLSKYIEANPSKKIIVVSHHLPSYELVNERYLNIKPEINSAYATDISISNHPNIKAWIAGHTHIPIEKGKFHVNPIGYPNEYRDDSENREKPNFNKTFMIL
ncbi:MAG: Noumeavirus [Bacteroidota bacterium]|jgi:predicted phosphodiesterase